MLLDDFFTEMGTPSPAAIRPTRPTSVNSVGRLKTLAAVGSSDTSDTKTAGAKPQSENKHLAPADGLDAIIDERADGFTFPLDGEPLLCTACTCWQSVPGLAWWCGKCACTGRSINTRSVCDRGFLDWQAAPVELRTAPQQPGEAGAEAVEATACAY